MTSSTTAIIIAVCVVGALLLAYVAYEIYRRWKKAHKKPEDMTGACR